MYAVHALNTQRKKLINRSLMHSGASISKNIHLVLGTAMRSPVSVTVANMDRC